MPREDPGGGVGGGVWAAVPDWKLSSVRQPHFLPFRRHFAILVAISFCTDFHPQNAIQTRVDESQEEPHPPSPPLPDERRRRKRGFNGLHLHIGKSSRAPPSQVNLLENERVITSGNTCIGIIISHSNHSIRSVMSHCEKIMAFFF